MAFKFENLKVWKDAVHFAGDIYKLSAGFPKREQFGLTSQINRAAVSISLNIAEGCGRNSDAEMARFIQIAIGSINEVVTVLYICLEQKYLNKEDFAEQYKKCEDLSRMLYSFRKYLKN